MSPAGWARLDSEIVGCRACPRLVAHREQVARVKRAAFAGQQYWGRPVPGFGDRRARVVLVGLAPAAHGANRTGRMFTGDSSGDLLYRTLWETGFASRPESESLSDKLRLIDAYITAPVHCAPPQNKPSRKEFQNCSCFFVEELVRLHHVQVVVVLGRLARDSYVGFLAQQGKIRSPSSYPFRHGAVYSIADAGVKLMCSYHPSRQNTQTGRLTTDMFGQVFAAAREELS